MASGHAATGQVPPSPPPPTGVLNSGSTVSTTYQHEHRSPPVPLVAIITPSSSGAHYQKTVTEFFLHSLRPPLVSLCCNEPVEQFVPRAFNTSTAAKPLPEQLHEAGAITELGILKAEWLTKHRQKRPAAALVIISREQLQGDPTTWNRLLFTLKFIRDAVTARGAGMVVAVAQGPGQGELPADRVTTVCHNLSLDPRSVIPLALDLEPEDEAGKAEQDATLKGLGRLLSDQWTAYYAKRAKHVADKHAQRQAAHPDGKCAPEINARMAIKLAVYAEFRQDWRTAVNEYQTAYMHVRSILVPPSSAPPQQRPSLLSSQSLHTSHSTSELAAGLTLPFSTQGSERHRSPLGTGASVSGSFTAPPSTPPSPYTPASPLPSPYAAPGRLAPEQPLHAITLPDSSSASAACLRSPQHMHHSSWGGGTTPGNFSGLPSLGGEQALAAGAGPGGSSSSHATSSAPFINPQLTLQRYFQAARVAELLQLKLLILLAYRERLEEAVAQATAHLQLFSRPPVVLPPAAAAAHAAYLARQMQVAAEVLAVKLEASGGALAAAAKECSRATLLSGAAQLVVDRRHLLDSLAAAKATTDAAASPDLDLSLIKRGPYVGTVVLKSDTSTRPLTEEEFVMWLEAEQLRSVGAHGGGTAAPTTASQQQPSALWSGGPKPVDAINAALHVLKDAHLDRQRARLALLLAEEFVCAGSLSAARKLLLQVAATYRKDGWEVPMAHVLLLLREVSARLRLPSEHLAYSLELAALLTGLSEERQSNLAGFFASRGLSLPGNTESFSVACVASLLSGHHDVAHLSSIMKHSFRAAGSDTPYSPLTTGGSTTSTAPRTFQFMVEHLDVAAAMAARRSATSSRVSSQTGAANPQPAAPSTPTRPPSVADLLHRHHQQDFGWSHVLGCAVSFPASVAPEDATRVPLYVSLCCLLPSSLPISGIDVTLADELASQWTVPVLEWPVPEDQPAYQPPPITPPITPHITPHTSQPTSTKQTLQMSSTAGMQPTTTDKHDGCVPESHVGHEDQALAQSPKVTSQDAHFSLPAPSDTSTQHDTVDGITHALHTSTLVATQSHSGATAPTTQRMQWQLGPMQLLDTDLQPGIWTPFATYVAPRGVGRLHVERVTVHIGQCSSVTFVVPSFPIMDPQHSLGSVVERLHGLDMWHAPPFKHASQSGPLGGPSMMVTHIGRLPSLKLCMRQDTNAYAGEPFLVAVQVQACAALSTSMLELAVRFVTPVSPEAHIAIIVNDRGTLERYHGKDVARLQLPSIQAGCSHVARVWVLTRHAGRVALAVTLQCPALVTQVVEFDVEEPLHLNVQLRSDPGTHVLVIPQQHPPMYTPFAAAPATAAAADSAAALPLTVGQQVLAHCALMHVGEAADHQLELLAAQVVDAEGFGISVLSDLNMQLTVASSDSNNDDQQQPSLCLGKSDVALLVASLLPSQIVPAPTPLGRLQVTWQRKPKPQPFLWKPTETDIKLLQASPGGHSVWRVQQQAAGALTSHALVGSMMDSTKGSASALTTPTKGVSSQPQLSQAAHDSQELDLDVLAQQQPHPSPQVTSTLELPRVCVQEGLLAVRVLAPPQATAGIAFSYTLQVQSLEPVAQDLLVTLLDAPGFVLSGDRGQQVTVPSRQAGGTMAVSWLLVAHTAGQLALPSVKVVAPRHNASLVTQPTHVHVLPF